jgi:hypothetical protein
VGGPKEGQPVIVAADLSPLGLGYQLTDVLLRLLPDSGVFTEAGDYGSVLQMIVQGESKVWDAAKILADAEAGHLALATEEAVKLVTGLSYIKAFVTAANLAGQHFGIPVLASLTTADFSGVLAAVDLAVLDTTVLSFDVQYLFTAHSEVHVTWPVPPAAPTNAKVTAGFHIDCPAGYPQAGPGWGKLRPSDDPSVCEPLDFEWSQHGTVTGFHIWVGGCGGDTPEALALDVGAADRHATLIDSPYVDNCYRISSYNSAGDGPKVPFAPVYWFPT